jgi:hypothetical protein
MIKDAYEDVSRYYKDQEENDAKTHKLSKDGEVTETTWGEVTVGNIV